MKATLVVTKLRTLLGVGRNDEILPAVQSLLERGKASPPMAALLIMDEDGVYFPHLVGMGRPTADKLALIQAGCRHFTERQLGPQLEMLRRAEVKAEVRAEVEAEVEAEVQVRAEMAEVKAEVKAEVEAKVQVRAEMAAGNGGSPQGDE